MSGAEDNLKFNAVYRTILNVKKAPKITTYSWHMVYRVQSPINEGLTEAVAPERSQYQNDKGPYNFIIL